MSVILGDGASGGDQLLAVGPGAIESDDEWYAHVIVLGQLDYVDIDTAFPRGSIRNGDYVAVAGDLAAPTCRLLLLM